MNDRKKTSHFCSLFRVRKQCTVEHRTASSTNFAVCWELCDAKNCVTGHCTHKAMTGDDDVQEFKKKSVRSNRIWFELFRVRTANVVSSHMDVDMPFNSMRILNINNQMGDKSIIAILFFSRSMCVYFMQISCTNKAQKFPPVMFIHWPQTQTQTQAHTSCMRRLKSIRYQLTECHNNTKLSGFFFGYKQKNNTTTKTRINYIALTSTVVALSIRNCMTIPLQCLIINRRIQVWLRNENKSNRDRNWDWK